MVANNVFNGVGRKPRKANATSTCDRIGYIGLTKRSKCPLFSSSLLFRYSLFFSDIFDKFMTF
jgi:hypothetical protein